nr:AsmA family protein [Chthonobacter rhizosphaerae]
MALLVALVGPLFVDWTAYRATFEQQATEILGHPVRVTGTADASILPVPTLAFTDVIIGAPDSPIMTVARFDLEVELFPLLSGEVRVTQMHLAEPELTVRVSEEGAFEWIAAKARVPTDPRKVVLDRVDIVGGRITIADRRHDRPLQISDVNAVLDARSLIGPYKLDGSAMVGDDRVMMRVSTGEVDAAGAVVVKGAFTPVNRPVAISIDGRARVEANEPKFAGTLRLDRAVEKGDPAEAATPWSVTATVEADASRTVAKQLEYHYGPEDRPFTVSGSASLDYAYEPLFDAVLSARQIDLDRTLGEGPDKPVSFDTVLAALSAGLREMPAPPVPTRVGLDIPGIVVGASIVQSVRLDASSTADGWMMETVEAVLPGRSTLRARGPLVTRPVLSFEGDVVVASEQPATLVAWWHPGRKPTTLQAFSAQMGMSASEAGLRLDNLDATVGGASIRGTAAYTPPHANRTARVALSLTADRVAVEQVQAMAALAASDDGRTPFADAELDLELSAGALTAGDAVAEGVDVRAALTDGTLAIDRLSVANLAGARLSAAGRVTDLATTPDGSIQARVSAETFDGVTALVRALMPQSDLADALQTAGPVLAPAALEATVEARAAADATALTVRLSGTAGGSILDGSLAFDGRVDRWETGTVDLYASAEGPNGARLMRQLGFDVPDRGGPGAGRVTVEAKGTPEAGLALVGRGSLGATEASVDGTLRLPRAAPAAADLAVRLKSDDVGPILALSGNLMADLLGSMPIDASADVAVVGAKATVSGITGTLDGEPIAGDLTTDFTGATPRVTGQLALRSATLEGLGELALGAGTLAMPFETSRNPWPEAPFGVGALDGVDTDVALALERLELTPTVAADGVALAIRNGASGLAFDGISGRIAGGTLTGSVVVKRDLEGQAAVDATFKLDGAPVDAFAWRRGDRPVVTGRLGVDLDLQANGRTVTGLVSSLSGGGAIRVEDGVIRSMNPSAFGAVIRAADADLDLNDDEIRQVFTANIDAGDLPFERLEGAFTLSSGTLRAPNLVVSSGTATTSGSAVLDLPRWRLESDWQLAVDPGADAVAGAVPQVALLFRGPIDDPSRTVDVTSFTAFLTLRAFEAEVERVEVMQADIQERELLRRTLQRSEDAAVRRRRAEEAAARRAAEEAAARQAAEAEALRRAAEDAARRAVEDPGRRSDTGGAPAPPAGASPTTQDGAALGNEDDGEFADAIRRKLEALRDERLRQDGTLQPLPQSTVGPPPGAAFLPGQPLDLTLP